MHPKPVITLLSKINYEQQHEHSNKSTEKDEKSIENLSDEIVGNFVQDRKLDDKNSQNNLNFGERIVERHIKLEKLNDEFEIFSFKNSKHFLWTYFKTRVPIYFVLCVLLSMVSMFFAQTNEVTNCLISNSFRTSWLRIIQEPIFSDNNQPLPPPM